MSYDKTAIAVAYLQTNPIKLEDLPKLLDLIENCGERAVSARKQPAVDPKKTVFPDFLVCLEDGKKLKMLRRHLRDNYDLTPEQYIEKWDLPHDYPMTAPNYSKKRQQLAKDMGLGVKKRPTRRKK
jgi:predicted transcriptional regulator